MAVRIVLLRGLNVGGATALPMAGFREVLAGLGLREVRTHIQSGNAVVDSDDKAEVLEPAIRDAIAARFGFAPEAFVLTVDALAEALADHPSAKADPSRVHVFFLKAQPVVEAVALRALALPGDAWHSGPQRFTLHTPGGIGRSKLADRLVRLLPAPMTARNLRTLAALGALAHP